MEEILTLRSAWLFDAKGNIKQLKNETDRPKAQEIFVRAREAMRYCRGSVGPSKLRRISFVNGKKEWTITVTEADELIVMQKDESLA